MADTAFDFADSPYPIRPDLVEAFRAYWQRLAAPGTWWTGSQRVAIAEETRRSAGCALCLERRTALSPHAVAGEHEATDLLPATAVDAVHRIASDPARLTRSWFEKLLAGGLPDTHYVEALGVVVSLVSIDAFHRALGLPLEPLPTPEAGEPSRRRPPEAAAGTAWVPLLPARRIAGPDADLYITPPPAPLPNVLRAMSLVPDAVRDLLALSDAMYFGPVEMLQLDTQRALDRAQVELVAGRVSAMRECFY
jgi:hypothetical protein